MTNQKGFSAIAGVILGLVILSAVVVGATLILKKSPVIFELENIKVGDVIAGMKVVSIKPLREGFPDLAATDNLSIKFSGETALTGKYRFDELFLGENVLDLDEVSQDKLPTLKVGEETRKRHFMCLNDSVSGIDYKRGGEGTFVIKDPVLNFFPSEGCASEGTVVGAVKQ